jgi:hypothetical protein
MMNAKKSLTYDNNALKCSVRNRMFGFTQMPNLNLNEGSGSTIWSNLNLEH